MNIAKTLAACMLAATPVLAYAAPTASSTTYVKMAGAGDLYERQSSTVLLQSTANPKLRSFAQMMVTDHTQSTADVKAAALKAGVRPAPPTLTPKQSSDIAALRAARGPARDTLYIDQQKAAHQQALALHQDEATNGSAPSLKAAATKIVPVVRHHIDMLAGM